MQPSLFMSPQEAHLKQENEQLKAFLFASQERVKEGLAQIQTYQIQLKQYQEAHEQMRHQLNELIRHRFGSKSERTVDSNNPQQDLFSTGLDTWSLDIPTPKFELPK